MAVSHEDILDGNMPTNTTIALVCGETPETVCAFTNLILSLALSSLTGVRAFIPIFIVALGAKLHDEFPLTLAGGEWLASWPSIVALGIFLTVEVVGDMIPGIDEVMDAIMLIVKPLMAIVMALIPFYGESDSLKELVMKGYSVIQGGILSEIVALFKAMETVATDAGSAGMCAPVRSIFEDVLTVGGTLAVIFVGVGLAAFLLVLIFGGIIFWLCWRKAKGKKLIPKAFRRTCRCWYNCVRYACCCCCCPFCPKWKTKAEREKGKKTSSYSDSDSESEEEKGWAGSRPSDSESESETETGSISESVESEVELAPQKSRRGCCGFGGRRKRRVSLEDDGDYED
eukprot:TRINITY_DN21158_c0_g2_i2.p1 TRINITY_DN21158_c0_g2~~TRINITY_DN21158_c0_g2_i2.p1  ORF type:complete len:360 (-),score=62.98 TRINITY_DN21158_c0_g2_i2:80-1108(-)